MIDANNPKGQVRSKEKMTNPQFQKILQFWFEELEPENWFVQSDETDMRIKEFLPLHQQASKGELWQWRESAKGRLAEIIILDQFSRNLFRNTPQAFACDGQALILAQTAIDNSADKELSSQEKLFCYIPFMHSESKVIQQKSIELFKSLDMEMSLKSATEHYDIVMQFGRYPHRNKVLGRDSTAEELEFLKEHKGF